MKRSEAIKIIMDVINKDQYQDYEIDEQQASNALEALEKAGMSPPDTNHYNSEYGEWRIWEEE